MSEIDKSNEENKEQQVDSIEDADSTVKRPHLVQYRFKRRDDNGGEIDYKINVKGRPSTKEFTNRQLRERELLLLLRKIKPHVASAIATAVGVMQNAKASDQSKLSAAKIILSTYKEVMESAYDKQYDESQGEEINQESTPIFSLKVINGDAEDASEK